MQSLVKPMKYQHFSLDPLELQSAESPNTTCVHSNRFFVATAVLLYVRTIRGEHCLITKRFVCAVKSFRGLFASHFKPFQKPSVNVSDWHLRTPNMRGRKVW